MPVDSAHRVNRKAIGLLIEDLETPALLLDGVSADRNIHRMADFFVAGLRLRPQFNSHRCLELARHQAGKGGTAGIACATVGEAEAWLCTVSRILSSAIRSSANGRSNG